VTVQLVWSTFMTKTTRFIVLHHVTNVQVEAVCVVRDRNSGMVLISALLNVEFKRKGRVSCVSTSTDHRRLGTTSVRGWAPRCHWAYLALTNQKTLLFVR
jgi:hypothetical protein